MPIPDGTGDTDNPHEAAHWWCVFLDGRTLDAAVRLAADVCRGAR